MFGGQQRGAFLIRFVSDFTYVAYAPNLSPKDKDMNKFITCKYKIYSCRHAYQ